MWTTLPTGEIVWDDNPSNVDMNEWLETATQDEVNNYYNNDSYPVDESWLEWLYKDLTKKAVPLIILYIVFSTKPWK